jgi:hypothetical protein
MPAEIAAAVRCLCSDEAKFTTGTSLVVGWRCEIKGRMPGSIPAIIEPPAFII